MAKAGPHPASTSKDFSPAKPRQIGSRLPRSEIDDSSSWSDVSDHETLTNQEESFVALSSDLDLEEESLTDEELGSSFSRSISLPTSERLGTQLNSPSKDMNMDRRTRAGSGKTHSLPPLDHRTANGLSSNSSEQGEKVKTKLMSVWNNMRYGWTLKMKTNFSYEHPIFLLGKCYHRKNEERSFQLSPASTPAKSLTMEVFKQDFTSRIWLTYRRDFPVIGQSMFTTDTGWGCMLRSGQMMLAQAYITHFLGRDWNVFQPQLNFEQSYHQQIIRWFGDHAGTQSPFSLHRLVVFGEQYGKKPGDWYGPSSVANILKVAVEASHLLNPQLSQVSLYVAQDCTVYMKDVLDMCTVANDTLDASSSADRITSNGIAPLREDNMESLETGNWRSVVILIPVRLGGEHLNPIYVPCVQALLAHDSCIGIIGGRPKHSLYFIGWQDDKLIYLDPHYCQDAVDTRGRAFSIQTYHCLSPRKMSFSKMDPSCTLGFYCRTREDFDKFVKEIKEMVAPPKQKGEYPMFVFEDGSSQDVPLNGSNWAAEEKYVRVRHLDSKGRLKEPCKESEDFVFLG